MSASLVGSEMCIRDRRATELGDALVLDEPPRARGIDERNSVPGHGPVSYTHLTLPTICSV
eukprot:4504882-Alexandrium_andersonii.AAC.1